jgi:hypothetical protein
MTQTTRRVDPVNELGNEVAEWGGNGRPVGGMVEVAMTRAAQEVQAAMLVAKKFPRNETAAFGRIMQACKRPSLAEAAVYEYPRGQDDQGKKNFVTGPSIRLAETLAQMWGNVDFGIIELEQRGGESSVMAYAWDLETNTRQTKIFTVRHLRYTRKGSHDLKDPRDIYELTANQGARRLRACILGIIPGDILEAAVAECEKTMAGKNDEPIADRVRKMLAVFSEVGVTQAMIQAHLSHGADAITERELQRLRKIYRSLKDNMASVEDYFPSQSGPSATDRLNDRISVKPANPPANVAPGESVNRETGEVTGAEPNTFDAGSPAGQPEAPAAKPAPDVSTWPKAYEAFRGAAMDAALPQPDLNKRVGAWLVGLGLKNTPEKTTPEQRAELEVAIRERRLDENGRIKPA